MVRYTDDFVICVQYKDDAVRILNALKERLNKFKLELSENKTRVIEFGRFAKKNANAKELRPATFNFFGFTHFINRTRKGGFKLGRKTDGKKLRLKLKEMNLWLKTSRNLYPIEEIWKTLRAKLRGHCQYYGVSNNFKSIGSFDYLTKKLTFKWMNRRSQKRSFTWAIFITYLVRHPLPKPAIHHDFYTGFAGT